MKKNTYYKIATNSYTIDQSGYSKYYKRFEMQNNGSRIDVYGLKQAREHLKEVIEKDKRYAK